MPGFLWLPRVLAALRGGAPVRSTAREIIVSVLSDPGCCREVNEDSACCIHPRDEPVLDHRGVLVVLADGMGGHAAGEVASHTAMEVVETEYYATSGGPEKALRRAFFEAGRRIRDRAALEESCNGMGTTCTALALLPNAAVFAHVGDSRLYRIRRGEIARLTEDDSKVMKMVKEGTLTLDEAREREDRNVLVRALGLPHCDVVASGTFPIEDEDRFLLCSDGLHDLVDDGEILAGVEASDPRDACAKLVQLAKQRGGFDNITVAVVWVDRANGGTRRAKARDTFSEELIS